MSGKAERKRTYKKPTRSIDNKVQKKTKTKIKEEASVFNNPDCCHESAPCSCPICWEQIPLLELRSCKHYLCRDCVTKVKFCPICRKRITSAGCNPQTPTMDYFENLHGTDINEAVDGIIFQLDMINRSDIFNIRRDLYEIVLQLCSKTSPYDVANAEGFLDQYLDHSRIVFQLFNERYPSYRGYFGLRRKPLTCAEENIIYRILANFVNRIKMFDAITPEITPSCNIMGGKMKTKTRRKNKKKRI